MQLSLGSGGSWRRVVTIWSPGCLVNVRSPVQYTIRCIAVVHRARKEYHIWIIGTEQWRHRPPKRPLSKHLNTATYTNEGFSVSGLRGVIRPMCYSSCRSSSPHEPSGWSGGGAGRSIHLPECSSIHSSNARIYNNETWENPPELRRDAHCGITTGIHGGCCPSGTWTASETKPEAQPEGTRRAAAAAALPQHM